MRTRRALEAVSTFRALAVGVILAVVAALFAVGPPARAATVHWVDAAAASGTPGTACGTDAGYTTVQAAVTAATSGDTIQVCPGTYTGNVAVTGTAGAPRSNLQILGAKAGVPAGPAANPAGRGTGESVIAGTISFTGVSTGATIDGLWIESGATHGITTGNGPFTFKNNVFRGTPNTPGGAATQNAIHTGNFSGYLVEANNEQGYRQFISGSTGGVIGVPSTVRNNYVSGWAPGANAIIFGSNSESGHVLSGNVIENGPAGANGINLSNGKDFQVTGNTIRNSLGNAMFIVQSVRTTGNQITGNDFTGNAIGVWFYADGSTVYPPAGSPANEVHQNNITGNTSRALLNQGTAGANDPNATCNWWGQASGPNTTAVPPNRVSAGVTYQPWLIAAAPGGACTGGTLAPTASFTATPSSGDAPLAVAFDASASSDPDGTIVSYDWDFGDLSTDSGVAVSHTYTAPGTYTATLTVTDNNGFTDTETASITVTAANVAPTASFTATPSSGDAPLAVAFDASASSDPDGTIVSYDWDFGDLSTDSGVAVSHTYTAPGTYTATLTVTDDDGATDTETASITVTAANVAPTASFTATPSSGTAPLAVGVDASASTDGDGTIVSYDWDFGDTGTGMGVTGSHTYTAPGTYTVTLTVTDDDGATDTETATVTVTAAPVPNTKKITAIYGVATVPSTVSGDATVAFNVRSFVLFNNPLFYFGSANYYDPGAGKQANGIVLSGSVPRYGIEGAHLTAFGFGPGFKTGTVTFDIDDLSSRGLGPDTVSINAGGSLAYVNPGGATTSGDITVFPH